MSIADRCEIVRIKDHDHWLAERQLGLGGSDCAAILGISKYTSPLALWMLKSGLTDKDEAGAAAKWGHRLERVTAQAYAEDTGAAIVEWPNISLVSREYPFMRANLDRLIVEPSRTFPAGKETVWESDAEPPGIIGILECKSKGIASPGTAHHWDDGATPPEYACQVCHYGLVTGIHHIEFAALIAGQGLVTRDYEWDDAFANDLLEVEKWFWNLVETGVEPPVDGSESTANVLKRRERVPDKKFDGGPALLELWEEYRRLQTVADSATTVATQAKNTVLAAIGDAEVALADGETLFTYRRTKGRSTLDADRLKTEMPEVYEEYLKVGAGYPRLMPARKGKQR